MAPEIRCQTCAGLYGILPSTHAILCWRNFACVTRILLRRAHCRGSRMPVRRKGRRRRHERGGQECRSSCAPCIRAHMGLGSIRGHIKIRLDCHWTRSGGRTFDGRRAACHRACSTGGKGRGTQGVSRRSSQTGRLGRPLRGRGGAGQRRLRWRLARAVFAVPKRRRH